MRQSKPTSGERIVKDIKRNTRWGNEPAFSSRAICCGEYKTSSFSWRFESILITMSPRLKSIAMPKVTTIPRQNDHSSLIGALSLRRIAEHCNASFAGI